jgi:hypothetical protein
LSHLLGMKDELRLDVAEECWSLRLPQRWLPHTRPLFRHLHPVGDATPKVSIELAATPETEAARSAAAGMRGHKTADATLEWRLEDRIIHCSPMSYEAYSWHKCQGELALLQSGLESSLLGSNLLLRHFAWRALQREMVPLHAAAIGANGSYWLLPAGSGRGKSVTTALALATGLEVLGDDFLLWHPATDTLFSLYCSVRLRPDGLDLMNRHFPNFAWRRLGLRDDGKTVLQPAAEHAGFRVRGKLRGILLLPDDVHEVLTPARVLKAFSSTTLLLRTLGFPPARAFSPLVDLVKRTAVAQLAPRRQPESLAAELAELCQ